MLAILNSLNVHNFSIFQPMLMILVSKFMVHNALFDKTYLSLGLRFPLMTCYHLNFARADSFIALISIGPAAGRLILMEVSNYPLTVQQ